MAVKVDVQTLSYLVQRHTYTRRRLSDGLRSCLVRWQGPWYAENVGQGLERAICLWLAGRQRPRDINGSGRSSHTGHTDRERTADGELCSRGDVEFRYIPPVTVSY